MANPPIRCYDNGGITADRYTVVFLTPYFVDDTERAWFVSVGMSSDPYHPQGVGYHNETPRLIDEPTSDHLGKPIAFTDLPEKCRIMVERDLENIGEMRSDETRGGVSLH
jgi:hypothetical protein